MKIVPVLLLTTLGFICGAEEKAFAPQSFYVSGGDLKVRFDARKFYTMNRIEYKGKLLGVDNTGSHYGTVFSFSGVGFIGTGHIENEKENLKSLDAWSNGKKIALENLKNNEEIKSTDFKLVRKSEIKGIEISNTIEIKDNVIYEEVELSPKEDIKIAFVYNFMHPWTTEMDRFAAETSDGKREEGIFVGDGKFRVNKDFNWAAFYSAPLKMGTVLRRIENSSPGKSIIMLWDKPPSYRKFYFKSSPNETLKKGAVYKLCLKTGFFECQPEEWLSAVEKTAVKE
ncbi:MAG: hypothetical protein A2020_13645 [Lentisphaerae bacterium GWF2_45_14]|nr:MAG: hypothetical protein A2020_13645 [Lentisphaerae bacterium GWF2_45_14]